MASVLPEDINDLAAWYKLDRDDIDLEELKARASEMSHDTYKELLAEIPEDDFIAMWVELFAEAATDPGDKLRRLQEGLYNHAAWPAQETLSQDPEFLGVMRSVNDIAQGLPGDPDVISKVLAYLLEDPEIWMFPLAPTAIVAAQRVREQDLRLILDTFLSAWDLSGETPVYRGSSRVEALDGHIEDAAPLIAVAVLNPAAPKDLVDAVLRICTFSALEPLKLAFWEYVSACLTDERRSGGYWAPSALWQSGFFDSCLDEDAPPMDAAHVGHVLMHFKDHSDALNLVNPWGERTLVSQVMTLLASRSDVDPQVLADIALNCSWVKPVQAAINNPKTPESAKAAGVLRLP
jgi:hypothetical protein